MTCLPLGFTNKKEKAMCQFKSVIVLRNGDILHDDYTDSHEELIGAYGLNDSGEPSINRFVRVEFRPEENKDYDKVSKYKLFVDESETPQWFEEHRQSVIDKLTSMINRMILKDVKRKYLLSGCYILSGNTVIDKIINSRVFFMYGTSQVGEMNETSHLNNIR